MKLDKVLLSGFIVLAITAILKFALPALGLNIDLSVFEDGDITLGDILYVVGLILLSVSGHQQKLAAKISSSKTPLLKPLRSIIGRKKSK